MSIDPATHRNLAVEANNSTWEILGRPLIEISDEDAEEMTRRAYAAAYHWQRADGATPANDARASWLLSRVWVARLNGHVALDHARRCLAVCESAGLTDFDRAYAHESLARAFALLGDAEQAENHRSLALEVHIDDPDNRALFESDVAGEPWFGLGH